MKFKICEFNSRRNFLKKSFSLSLALAALNLTSPFLLSCSKHSSSETSSTTHVSSGSDVTYNSSSKILELNSTSSQAQSLSSPGSLIVINSIDSNQVNVMLLNSSGTIKAFTALCPHQGFSNQWSFSNNELKCSVHNSLFDDSGNFLSKSSTIGISNLTSYLVTVSSGNIQVQLT